MISVKETNNYENNLDKWISGENKILYITGLMGSGKSTIGRQLSKQYNCQLLELDLFDKTIDEKYKKLEDREYIDFYFNKIKKDIKIYDKIIIEGVQILYFNMFKENINFEDSILIVNTSFLNSTFKSIKRDGITQTFNNILNNIQFQKQKNEFINNIK